MPRRTVGQFGANACGRDLVVGDVHGCFRTLEHTLSTLDFAPARDRLFGVGDRDSQTPELVEDRRGGSVCRTLRRSPYSPAGLEQAGRVRRHTDAQVRRCSWHRIPGNVERRESKGAMSSTRGQASAHRLT